jgi:regulation of enolase protein 1 (concanavalin A-like superfamily)
MSTTMPALTELEWSRGEGEAVIDGGALTLTAAAGTDWTNDAGGAEPQHRSTSLGFVPEGDFRLSARVRVEGERTTFDAGVLAIWVDETHWAKVCFEWSPQGTAMVVSVVTNEFSDDVNSTDVDGDAVYLRVSRVGPAWAFHSSTDGAEWRFVRVFRLASDAPVHVGFMAQAPMGDSCAAVFDEIAFVPGTLGELRDGS